MRRLNVISIVALTLVTGLFPIAEQGRLAVLADNLRASKIAGVVVDANDARIVGATIRIENARLSRVVQSGDEGTFEVEIPAGVYRITVEMDGFERFVLSTFRVKAGARESVQIHMKVQPPQMPLKIE
jgi:hypothetical protein